MKKCYSKMSRVELDKYKDMGIVKQFLHEHEFNSIINNEPLMVLVKRLNEFRKDDAQAIYSFINKERKGIMNSGDLDVWFTLKMKENLFRFIWKTINSKMTHSHVSVDMYYDIVGLNK